MIRRNLFQKVLPLFNVRRNKFLSVIDGNTACSHVAYAFSEASFIYPITPSSPMAENMDQYTAAGRKNIFGSPAIVTVMQAESGAAGAVHGSLAAGALTTTFTSSQGLLLMIPNMYKISGELMPGVFHVAARAVAGQALSIFGDHQDVMATRAAGFCQLCSGSVQEVTDMALVAHLSALKSSLPFTHFFDGFRTSHEISKVELMDYDEMKKLVDMEDVKKFKNAALNPEHPHQRGTAQSPEIYFQLTERANILYDKVPQIVENEMKRVSKVTGRTYNLFDYYGAQDADKIIILMGSGASVAKETIDFLNNQGEQKVGMVVVRLFRPWSPAHLMKAIPKSVKKICVLDRTKEPGALGDPLYLDVATTLRENKDKRDLTCGRYGLGSKDFKPADVLAVFENMDSATPKNHFIVGIEDDVTQRSLKVDQALDTVPKGTVQCLFYGIGGDGTVGANHSAIKIIGENTKSYAQGYFQYDAKKSGGLTISHLRFGPEPITSQYLVSAADYIAVSTTKYVYMYDVISRIKKGGIFVLNAPWSGKEEIEKHLPNSLKKQIAEKEVKFYVIDALKIGQKLGLGQHINMIMQSVFFKLSQVLPVEEALELLKNAIRKEYKLKGKEVIAKNVNAVEQTLQYLESVEYDAEAWKGVTVDTQPGVMEGPDFVKNVMGPITRLEGDNLPVSAFPLGGMFPMGTAAYEKRGVAFQIPEWNPEYCTQCCYCSFVCPHATIRPYLIDSKAKLDVPEDFVTVKASEKKLSNYNFRIQVSPLDCMGCGNCAEVCPTEEGKKALVMKPLDTQNKQIANWQFAEKLPLQENLMKKDTLKGTQLRQPLLEFSGACAGCGETPYVKLVTQLFGDRMILAQATGCSSIWGGSAPSCPYTTNKTTGFGVAWGNSLFEDNAEYGLGMAVAVKAQRNALANQMKEYKGSNTALKTAFNKWIENMNDADQSKVWGDKIKDIFHKSKPTDVLLKSIADKTDLLTKKSMWIIGGDGWAYDIGYGGLNHVLASGEDVNILVLDTEVYSNTGGQASKATPMGAVAKFAASGKKTRKTDLGALAMAHEDVYVASVAMGARRAQLIKALLEAESYKGTSIIIAYAPCIAHGIKGGMLSQAEEVLAVESGFWPLYRRNPLLRKQGKNPFQLDSKEPKGSFKDFINRETRFNSLNITFPEEAKKLHSQLEIDYMERYKKLKKLADQK